MSGASSLPRRSSNESDGLEDLEELGDDAIIAQQTAAHVPRPRAQVAEESRSVVIADQLQRSDAQPVRRGLPRASGEATLVIRDRRALADLRANIERRKFKQGSRRRPLYLWGALGVAAFVLGGVVAFLATDARSEQTSGMSAPPSNKH